MGNSPTPPGLLERILLEVDRRIASFARSGFLRNATISEGGLTIKGGFLKLLSKATGGVTQFYLGPVGDLLGNGEYQQFWRVKRADGTTVLMLWDAFPGSDGTLNQALSWIDRSGNVVFADDTDSGQGIARPYVPAAGYPAQARHWPSTGSGTWETLYRARMPKQHPKLFVRAWGACDTAGTTGEIRVMVNGAQLGTTHPVVSGVVSEFNFGPAAVADGHMQELTVELDARRTGGTGSVQTCFSWVQGQQT